MTDSIGFIGLGALGAAMAENLLDAGRTLRVYNRTANKADPLVARGAARAERAVDTVTRGGVVVSVLWDDAALEDVVTRDGFLEALGDGVHISMATVSPATAKKVAALHAKHGSTYLDAPVFGRPEAARARQLLVPIAGPAEAKARVKSILTDLGAHGVYDFGAEIGAGVAVKLAGNFLIFNATRALEESVAFARGNGVDARALVDMLTSTLFASPIYQSYGKRIADDAPPLVSAIPAKDIGLLRRTAQELGVATPLADALKERV